MSALPGPAALGSLRRRLFLAALVFVAGALVVAGIAIGAILYRFARAQVDGRLDAQIAAIASDLKRGPDGAIRLERDLDAPPFDRRHSGWYWQVAEGETVLRSGSLGRETLDLASLPNRPGLGPHPDPDRPEPGDGAGPRGEALVLRVLRLPAAARAGPATIVATAPAAALRGPVAEAARTLALTLGLLGLCLVAGVVVQVRLGLRPLERLRRDLAAVRSGERARVPEAQPAEIRPLVEELNGLLDQNATNLERARTHVANLAHGLKTPLATLTMALGDPSRDPGGDLSRLVATMDGRVRHHLRRARSAALGGPARTRTDLRAHAADLADALRRLHVDRSIAIEIGVPEGTIVACDGQDVDEMLGNLLDNACRWARTRVRVSSATVASGVAILVEDDGPGLDPDAVAAVMERGRRLDETVPGHGFGLPITLELAELYGGGLQLRRSALGGLRAELRLPA